MRKYKEVTKTETKKVLDVIVCDLCGDISPSIMWTDDWYKSNSYEINNSTIEITVKREEGHTCGCEGGEKTTYWVDICPACFKERLIPWLESQGVSISTEKVDW